MTLTACKGCGQLVSPGPRCGRCQRAWDRRYAETRPEWHALYQTSAWKRLSAEVRAGATRCHWCLRPTRRLVADHVIPLEQRPDLALDRSNLVPACVGCNTRRGRNAKLPDLKPTPGPEPRHAADGGASRRHVEAWRHLGDNAFRASAADRGAAFRAHPHNGRIPSGPLGNVPEPPYPLRGRALAEWRRLAPRAVGLGVLTDADLPALAAVCRAFARAMATGDLEWHRAYRDGLARFGLDPASRTEAGGAA